MSYNVLQLVSYLLRVPHDTDLVEPVAHLTGIRHCPGLAAHPVGAVYVQRVQRLGAPCI